ncbi:hypothetical protein FGG08_006204 [Glutinoglossum americanum]|uniref:protein S-acyltransferase n=1 Tax=Glutinoglossum americanum TaxID=1670608 RepID=A0A9P8KV82_9PEZI|nr:hypothetical protein FGG08_006204 [Glutinoglossum americanum]
MKTIRIGRSDLWDTIMREIETLRKREHNNIVPLLASFTINALGSEERSLNILFPWADMNMKQWLQLDSTPLGDRFGRNEQRNWIYREIFALVSAVSFLHRNIDGEVTSHHDLKPENILWLGESLKICDLGRSHLLPLAEGSETEGQSGLGTFTYQPPEYYNDDVTRSSRKHGRAFDVWSLGCIIIEMTVLIVYGWEVQKVNQFTKARSASRNRRRDFSKIRETDDSFHNNMGVVGQWISDLKEGESRMLVQVLDIAEKMLVDDPDNRVYSWEAELDMYEMLHPDDHRTAQLEKVQLCVQPPKQGSVREAQNPLHRAAMSGSKDRAAMLLASGWPVDARDGSGMTPLQLAFYRGHAPVVELLADRGANMDLATIGSVALKWAEAANRKDLIRILQQHKANSETALHGTSYHASSLELGPLAKDEFGKTTLHWVSQRGSIDELRKILDNVEYQSPLIQDKDKNGLTPLHWAAKAGQLDAAVELLKFEAAVSTIEERDNFGKTPVHHSADKGATEIVHVLLSKCVHPRLLVLMKDRNGKTPLHWAAQGNHAKVVELLLRPPEALAERSVWELTANIMLSDMDDNGNTPLRLARGDEVLFALTGRS